MKFVCKKMYVVDSDTVMLLSLMISPLLKSSAKHSVVGNELQVIRSFDRVKFLH